MASTSTYKPQPGEGKARSPEQPTWTAQDAKRALAAGQSRAAEPEAEDAFSPTPPAHPEGKKMAPRPPGQVPHTPPSGDLWDIATKLAEQRAAGEEELKPSLMPSEPPPAAVNLGESSAPTTTDLVKAAVTEAERLVWQRLKLDPIAGNRLVEYLNQRHRVTMELQDGTFTMPITHYIQGKYSVTLIIPLDKNGTTFVPKPGTKLTLVCGDRYNEEVYFPGSYAEIEPLTVAVMTFIRSSTDEK